MSVDSTALSATIAAIHQASISPELWHEALRSIMQLVRASKGSILEVDATSGEFLALPAAIGHDAVVQKAYADHYYKVDPTIECCYGPRDEGMLQVYEAFPLSIRNRHEYFDFTRSIDVGDVLGLWITGAKRRRTVVSLQRPYSAQGFDADAKQILDLLSPHLKIARHVQDRVNQTFTAYRALASGLSRFDCAALLVDSSATIFELNDAANELLAKHQILVVSNRKLISRDSNLNQRLQNSIRKAATSLPANSVLPIPIGESIAEAVISPLRPDHEVVRDWEQPLVLIVIFNKVADKSEIVYRMRRLYNLTHSEANVMAEIALGMSVEEITTANGVQNSTVRSQLRSIFVKTGANRQSDLVRLAIPGALLKLGPNAK